MKFLNGLNWYRRSAILALALLATLPAFASQQEHQSEPVGSLASVGEVFVNGSPAPSEATVFSGQTVQTQASATAALNVRGKGNLRISPESQLIVSGSAEYLVEFKAGTVVLDTSSGPSGLTIRVGNFVVVPSVPGRVTLAKLEKQPDGNFIVSCLSGTIGVIPLNGSSGEVLQTNQSLQLSPQAGMILPPKLNPILEHLPQAAKVPHGHTGWIILGLAGGGAGGAAAALSHGGGKQSPSPSTP